MLARDAFQCRLIGTRRRDGVNEFGVQAGKFEEFLARFLAVDRNKSLNRGDPIGRRTAIPEVAEQVLKLLGVAGG